MNKSYCKYIANKYQMIGHLDSLISTNDLWCEERLVKVFWNIWPAWLPGEPAKDAGQAGQASRRGRPKASVDQGTFAYTAWTRFRLIFFQDNISLKTT